jgi:prefoldin subunit 5
VTEFAGFRIQFAFDHLKRVAHAHFGLYVEKQENNALDKLDRDIEKLYKDIEALKGKRERIKSVKSSLIKECLREASTMRRGKAGVGPL